MPLSCYKFTVNHGFLGLNALVKHVQVGPFFIMKINCTASFGTVMLKLKKRNNTYTIFDSFVCEKLIIVSSSACEVYVNTHGYLFAHADLSEVGLHSTSHLPDNDFSWLILKGPLACMELVPDSAERYNT